MPSPGQELSSIDFESMIGGPLVIPPSPGSSGRSVQHQMCRCQVVVIPIVKISKNVPGLPSKRVIQPQ